MNLDTLRKMLANEELQGLANGTMQVRQKNDPWDDGSQYAFNGDYESYEFRPTPQPPKKVVRPWTADELWEYRNCWFRNSSDSVRFRLEAIGPGQARFDGEWLRPEELLRRFVYFHKSGEWKSCGVEVEVEE